MEGMMIEIQENGNLQVHRRHRPRLDGPFYVGNFGNECYSVQESKNIGDVSIEIAISWCGDIKCSKRLTTSTEEYFNLEDDHGSPGSPAGSRLPAAV